jgi:hypothetical protein
MKKSFKYVLVAAVVGTGAYLWWKSNQKPKIFANLGGGIDEKMDLRQNLRQKRQLERKDMLSKQYWYQA